jgi:hypothetical protein
MPVIQSTAHAVFDLVCLLQERVVDALLHLIQNAVLSTTAESTELEARILTCAEAEEKAPESHRHSSEGSWHSSHWEAPQLLQSALFVTKR